MKIPSKKQRKKGFNESQRLHPGCGTRSKGGRKKERKKEERKEEEDWQSIQPELKRLAIVVVLVVVVTAVPNRPGGFSCAPGRGGGPREWGELMRTGGGGGGFPKQLAAISTDPIKINEAERGLRVEGASFAPPSAPSPSLASRLDTRLSLFHCGSRQVPSTSRGNSARLVVADAAARREIGGEGGGGWSRCSDRGGSFWISLYGLVNEGSRGKMSSFFLFFSAGRGEFSFEFRSDLEISSVDKNSTDT